MSSLQLEESKDTDSGRPRWRAGDFALHKCVLCCLRGLLNVLCAILLGEAAILCSSLDSDSYSAVSNTDADLANAAEIALILGDAGLEPIMEEEESDALMDAAFELRKILLWKANNEGERTESDFD